MMANDTSLEGDAIKTRYAIEVLRRHRPAFMTVHLSSLDDAEHSFGPFSREADADMEALDGQIGALVAAARRANPATVVVVVSDHGFMPVPQRVNLAVPFVQAGLIDLEDGAPGRAPRIRDWRAQPWFAGGMAAIMLKDPQDAATSAQVGTLLRQLAAEPANGIAGVHSREQMRTLGGFPDAAYVVDFLPGYYAGSNTTGPLVTAGPPGHGGHGFSPELPEMRSAFFIAGPGIAAGRDLGIIDMRQIAPTVAGLLGVRLPDARAAALAVRREERLAQPGDRASVPVEPLVGRKRVRVRRDPRIAAAGHLRNRHALHVVEDGQRRGGLRATAGRQHGIGSQHEVAERARGVRSEQHLAGIADPSEHRQRFCAQHLEVLGGVGVDELERGIEVARQHDAAVVAGEHGA
jgi:hypothetical protein